MNPRIPCLGLLATERATAAPRGDDLASVPPDLDAVYRLYARQVSSWAQRLAGPRTDVEDIVHDVFLVVQRRLEEFRGEAQLGTWLFEITVRVVQSHRRRLMSRCWSRRTSEGRDPPEVADEGMSPLEDLERREATALLYRFLNELNEKYRTALILFELEGLSCQQIAVVTNTSLANVWARVSRGREKLLCAFANWDSGKKR